MIFSPCQDKQSRGFTVVEILIVTFIIGLLAAILVANMRRGDAETNLRFAVQNFSNVLRQAQTMAASGKAFSGSVPAGYGVLTTGSTSYSFFADQNDNGRPEPAEILEIVLLPSHITLDRVNEVILFRAPDGKMLINGSHSGCLSFNLTSSSTGHSGAVTVCAHSGLIESSF